MPNAEPDQDAPGDVEGSVELPGWVTDPPLIITKPAAAIAGIIIGWIIGFWEAFIGYIDSFWSTLADIPQSAIYQPIATAFARPGNAIQDAWREVGAIAVDVSEVAGPFAPIVIVGVWLVPALLGVTVLYFVWGIVETYFPVGEIPVLRRIS